MVVVAIVVLSETVLARLTAQQMARGSVEANVDATDEGIAAFLSGNNWAHGNWAASRSKVGSTMTSHRPMSREVD